MKVLPQTPVCRKHGVISIGSFPAFKGRKVVLAEVGLTDGRWETPRSHFKVGPACEQQTTKLD